MSFIESLIEFALLIAFLLGTVCGIIGGASLAFWREGRGRSLNRTAPDPLCEGVRVLQAANSLHGGQDAFGSRDDGDPDTRRRGVRP
jgi:hypothetical protein